MSGCALTLSLIPNDIAQFAPRLGTISLTKLDGSLIPDLQTPSFIVASSRGLVPHLSRDHVKSTRAVRWANIPFEPFLERKPPVPTLQGGYDPLHAFLGFPKNDILSLSLRDPFDGREMPANSKDHVSASCIRGVRKVTPTDWRNYALACKPDLVVALSDVPYTNQPHSQKRTSKSIERSVAWLADFLRPALPPSLSSEKELRPQPFNVLVNLVGGIDPRARTVFAESLVETLHGKEQEQIRPLRSLDEGVSGYILDLLPLRISKRLRSETIKADPGEDHTYTDLARASFGPLPQNKLRIAYSIISPHDILHFIRDVGIDLFDSHWAQRAANIGIALDFRFPVIPDSSPLWNDEQCPRPRVLNNGKRQMGHNLYSEEHAHHHVRLANSFLNATNTDVLTPDDLICPCGACSPSSSSIYLKHSAADVDYLATNVPQRPYTRSYLHHLLHTHEMSAHALLVMHNLSVLDAFFAGVRSVLRLSPESFSREIDRFLEAYDESTKLFAEAEQSWRKVDSERGKGRLQREKQLSGQVSQE